MNSRYWKNSLRQINNGLDKCDATLDALSKKNNMDDVVSKEIYKSPDTLVEVNIRTKKKQQHSSPSFSKKSPSSKALSVPSTKLQSSKRTNRVQPHPSTYKRNLHTKGHRLKNKVDDQNPVEYSPKKASPNKSSGKVTFQHRTLRLVLNEIKSTLTRGDVDLALQHLQDVEYIALNLNGDGLSKMDVSPCKKPHVSDELDRPDRENKVATKEKEEDLRRELDEANKRLDHALKLKKELHNALDTQERKMEGMKELVGRLSSTNEDMVIHLKEKIRLEDSLKALENTNSLLAKKYEEARTQGLVIQRTLKGKELEIMALHKVIEDMKKTLTQDLNPSSIRHTSFQEEAPSLSSEVSKLSLLSESSIKSIDSPDEGIFSESLATVPKILRSPPTKDNSRSRDIETYKRQIPKNNLKTKDQPNYGPSSKDRSRSREEVNYGQNANENPLSRVAEETYTGQNAKATSQSTDKTNNGGKPNFRSKDERTNSIKDSSRSLATDEIKYGQNAALVKDALNEKVKDFLNKMKKGSSSLDVSLPDVPTRRSFEESSLPLNLTEDDTLSATLASKLTDSSLFLSSNESSSSATSN